MNRFFYSLLVIFAVFNFSCNKDSNSDLVSLEDYISTNNLTVQDGPRGLKYFKHNTTTGASPKVSQNIEIIYSGKLTNDKSFDSSKGKSVVFALSRLIPGWQLGIPLMHVGETMTLYIPSELGYGATGAGTIPPNADLIFEIELIAINP